MRCSVFWILFLNFNQLPAAKTAFKNGASQERFGPSYFDRALAKGLLLKHRLTPSKSGDMETLKKLLM